MRLETHSYEKTFKTYSVETPNHKLVVKNDTSCIGKWDVTQTHGGKKEDRFQEQSLSEESVFCCHLTEFFSEQYKWIYFQLHQWWSLFDRLYSVFSAVPVTVTVWRIVLCIFSCSSDSGCLTDCPVFFSAVLVTVAVWRIVLYIFSCTSGCLMNHTMYFHLHQWQSLFDGLYCVFSAVTDCTVYFQLHQWQREKQQQLPRWWCLLAVMMCLWPQVWMAQQGVTIPPWCKFSDLLPTGVWVSSGCKITWCPQECGSVLAVRLPGAHKSVGQFWL